MDTHPLSMHVGITMRRTYKRALESGNTPLERKLSRGVF